jgi:hypothetical protein
LAELVAAWPAERLVAIWNSLPGVAPVKKFKDRTTAATRIWKNIQNLGESVKPEPAQPVQPKAGSPMSGGVLTDLLKDLLAGAAVCAPNRNVDTGRAGEGDCGT